MTLARAVRFVPVLLLVGAVAGSDSLAGVTSLLVDTQPLEAGGPEGFHFSSAADGSLLPGSFGNTTDRTNLVFLDIRTFWSLDFGAPAGQPLAPGIYEDAVPPYNRTDPGQPILLVVGARDAVDCDGSVITGRFEVEQVGFGADGALTLLWATFEQTCADAVLRGEVRYNAEVPIVLDAPPSVTALEGRLRSFAVEGHDTLGNPVTLSATGLPPGATFADAGDGTGRFDWTPGAGQTGVYWTAFHGQSATGDADTVYTRVEAMPDFDDFDHALPIPAVPFDATVDRPEAGTSADDPTCLVPAAATVWYSYTPGADGYILASASPPFAGGAGVGVSIHTGARGALEQLDCGWHSARAQVMAGQTYHVMLGLFEIPTPQFRFSLGALPPPPSNDSFEAATVVASLPFAETIDTTNTGFEPGDPGICGGATTLISNVWYSYTPAQDTRVTIDTAGSTYNAHLSVFAGPRGALVPVACHEAKVSFAAHAGRTYHIMISSGTGGGVGPGGGGSMLQVSFTGMPALAIAVAVARDGIFDPHDGQATIHGIARCSKPARIVVAGTLWQGQRAQGDFETTVDCTGVSPWRTAVTAVPGRGGAGRFTGGPAAVTFHAVGVPADDPDDVAADDGRSPIRLKGAPPR